MVYKVFFDKSVQNNLGGEAKAEFLVSGGAITPSEARNSALNPEFRKTMP